MGIQAALISKAASVLIAFVAVEHLTFLVLEMFLWTTPFGQQVFGLTPAFAEQSSAIAANQGLYNGFLAAGLIWSMIRKEDTYSVKIFFLLCVVVAGIFGAITVKSSILIVQGTPALAALLLLVFSHRAGIKN
jgi:putative membrane protein